MRRARPGAANAALASEQAAHALEALGTPESLEVPDVVGVRLAMGRGLALAALTRLEESAGAFLAAAEAAQRLGWLVRASSAYYQAGTAAHRGSAFGAALKSWERLLALCERRADRAWTAVALAGIGNAYYAQGDNAQALATYERALATQEALGDQASVATTLGNIGNVYYVQRDFAKALPAYERALAAQEALGDRTGAATTLGHIGAAHRFLGSYDRALAAQERALTAQEVLEDRAGAAVSLGRIGMLYFLLGNLAKAGSALEREIAAHEALGNRAAAAGALGSIGLVYAAQGDYARALAAQERSLLVAEEVGDKAGAALALRNIGAVHHEQGDYADALSSFEREMSVEEALGDRLGAASTLASIGLIHSALGDYARALSTQERALAALEALGDRSAAALTLGNIGNIHLLLGDYAKALSTYARALAAKEALGEVQGAALTLCNMGVAYAASGDPARALGALERALAAQEALGDKAGAAKTLRAIGTAHLGRGDHALALSILGCALVMQEALGLKDEIAQTLGTIGGVHYALGDYAEALSKYEQTLAAMEALADKMGAAISLGNIGNCHFMLGRHAEALAYERRAVVSAAALARGLGAEEGAGARESFAFIYDTGASAAIAADNAPELAFFLESGRAGALLEGLKARDAIWSTAVPAELRAEESKARAAEDTATKALRAASDAADLTAIRARRVELDAAREQVSATVAHIQREAKAGAALVYPVAATLDEIRATLVEGDALVLYGMFTSTSCALVVTAAQARIVALGETSPIEAAVQALTLDDSQADPTAALAALRGLVVTPLGLPPATRRLLVSPSGALGHVPFTTLVPDATVSYVPSGTTYRLLLEEQGLRGEGVLALGDPDYQTQLDEQALAIHRGGTKRLLPLPGTREEAKAVGTVALLGADATEAGLRSALVQRPRWRAVHLACHGFVDTARPALSSLALTASGDQDGFLTALDVFRMKIPADLVVLSACETGKGKVVKTEGIVGLTRAFMFAGSPRILCSLWKVPDGATRALMTKFYELWNPKPAQIGSIPTTGVVNPGLPAPEALRQAQVYVRSQEQWKHPYYWAAWVLWGLPD